MMEIFILANRLICRHEKDAYCFENFFVFQSFDISWISYFAAQCHGQTVLFLNKEETPHVKWRLQMKHSSINVRNVFI